MYGFTSEEINLDAIRERIAKMTDLEVEAYGQAAAWMAEHSTRKTWKVQLEEARAEWRRRHPKSATMR
jgi:hypothetical protein